MESFDFITLGFLCAAVVVFLKLLSVLGTRTGHEKPPASPLSATETKRDNIIDIGSSSAKVAENNALMSSKEIEKDFSQHAGSDEVMLKELQRIAKKDPSFTPTSFLEGAKKAFEIILNKYADHDIAGLKKLVGEKPMQRMKLAIEQQQEQDISTEFQFIGFRSATLHAVQMVRDKATITVDFVAEIIMADHNAQGAVISGNPTEVQERKDRWTFERKVTSSAPHWLLIRTEAIVA